MKIGIDARFISVPGGIPRYCRELLIELSEQNPRDTYVALVKKIPHDFPERKNIEWVVADVPWYSWREQFSVGALINKRRDVELWHFPHWNIPFSVARPFIMTVHDFIFEDFPTHDGTIVGKIKFFTKWVLWRMLLIFNLHRAKKIITVSGFVHAELIARFPWTAKKLEMIYNGVPSPQNQPSRLEKNNRPYYLIVGNSYPHKNQKFVFETLIKYQELVGDIYVATHRDRFSEQRERELPMILADRVHFVFDPSDAKLAELYAGARALIIASLSEGFGITPLEAMSYGIPVVAARTSCLPEILGDTPLWFNPHEPKTLRDALAQLESTSNFYTSEAKSARILYAARFNWKTTAISTQKIYKNVLY